MTHENKKLRRWFAARPCEICPVVGWSGNCPLPSDPFHIIACGHGGGTRLDVRYNLLSCCRVQHRRHHDGNLKHDGRKLRQEELFELVALREGLPDEVDLQQVLWLVLRLPKDATLPQMSRAVALLPMHDRAVCWKILKEMGKVTT